LGHIKKNEMKNKTTDVFGVKSTLIKTYIEREKVDKKFKEAINDGNEVIVYGSSKQGKTTLILNHLNENDYIKVECSPQTKSIDIYKSILRQLGIGYLESETNTETNLKGGKINGGFKIKIPMAGEIGVGSEVNETDQIATSTKQMYFEYNLELAQDVSELLKTQAINKYIVLENFHYLTLDVQETLAYDLRVFQDHQIIFIILGIWREANRLVQFNGDLLDRISEVPVEPWEKVDFSKVIEKGEILLNVDFSKIKEEIINCSFDSIGVVQEICKQCCVAADIYETVDERFLFKQEHLTKALDVKSKEYGVRHNRNFEAFVDISKKTSTQSGKASLAFPYYFIQLLLTFKLDNIENGLSRAVLLEEIRKIHHRPNDVRSGDLGAFLHNITQHQMNKKINPPFVDYDRGGKTLKIIDSSLYFFLRNCDRKEIIDDLPNPLEN
jgi:hypothetical protein